MTLILFTTRAPHPFAEQLMLQGQMVYEAIAISEVFALADQHQTITVIITADVDSERAKAIQHHYTTLRLTPQATVKDIVWELGGLTEGITVQ